MPIGDPSCALHGQFLCNCHIFPLPRHSTEVYMENRHTTALQFEAHRMKFVRLLSLILMALPRGTLIKLPEGLYVKITHRSCKYVVDDFHFETAIGAAHHLWEKFK